MPGYGGPLIYSIWAHLHIQVAGSTSYSGAGQIGNVCCFGPGGIGSNSGRWGAATGRACGGQTGRPPELPKRSAKVGNVIVVINTNGLAVVPKLSRPHGHHHLLQLQHHLEVMRMWWCELLFLFVLFLFCLFIFFFLSISRLEPHLVFFCFCFISFFF